MVCRLLDLRGLEVIELDAPPWWDTVPALLTRNLRLREVETADASALLAMLTDPRVSRYISPPPSSLALLEGFIAWAQHERAAGRQACFAVLPHGARHPIGLFQVRASNPEFTVAEWGFAIHADFWASGVFEEAAVKVVEFSFTTVGVHRLEARAVVENGRANRALEKLGATSEAILRRAFGGTHAQFLWSIVADEWSVPDVSTKTPFDAARTRRQILKRLAEHEQRLNGSANGEGDWQPYPFFLTGSAEQE
jgi:ribosomal-protein-alanine N-acetyltransferase